MFDPSRLIRRVKRFVFFGCGVVAAALLAGAVFQIIATRSDYAKYPPPGQIITIRGQGLHLNCTGVGDVPVILEAGLGGGSLDWSLVQAEVAKFGRVCSYDRFGMAWSSSAGGSRTAGRITDELHQLLEAAKIAPPYVLVGHSIGGIFVQMFASRYPEEVAGVVLVDSSHEEQLSRIPAIPAIVPHLYRISAPFGIARMVNLLAGESSLPIETAAARAALYSHTRSVFSAADEMAAIPESMAELRSSPMQLADKPLFVLSRGLKDGFSPEILTVWLDLQASLAKRSSNGNLVIANGSGHYIQFSEPELIISSVRQVIDSKVIDR